jgi:hypothetical protein
MPIPSYLLARDSQSAEVVKSGILGSDLPSTRNEVIDSKLCNAHTDGSQQQRYEAGSGVSPIWPVFLIIAML